MTVSVTEISEKKYFIFEGLIRSPNYDLFVIDEHI